MLVTIHSVAHIDQVQAFSVILHALGVSVTKKNVV